MLSVLIFPETEPAVHTIAQLLLFFEELACYMPTEQAGTTTNDNSFFANLCTRHVPAPLGPDLSRFNRLLRDLETSRPHEISRLFSAATGPVATGQVKDREEASAASVFSALHKDTESIADNNAKERLWQARLVLRLAEIMDRREEEVRQGLAQISSLEQKVFAALEGPGETTADELHETGMLNAPLQHKKSDLAEHDRTRQTSRQLIPLRMKAWAELFLSGTLALQPVVLATGSQESGSILLDGFETSWRREPQKLFSLSIPAVYPVDSDVARTQYLASRKQFRQGTQKNLHYLTGLLRTAADLSTAEPISSEMSSILSENINAWEEKIKTHFSPGITGLTRLDCYSFPGVPFTELFLRLFHLEKPVSPKKGEHPTGILAVLNS